LRRAVVKTTAMLFPFTIWILSHHGLYVPSPSLIEPSNIPLLKPNLCIVGNSKATMIFAQTSMRAVAREAYY